MNLSHRVLITILANLAFALSAIPSLAQDNPSPTTAPTIAPVAPAKTLYTHPGTGLQFPSRMGDFLCQSVLFFNEDRDVGVQYLWPQRADVSIYVYPAPENTSGPTFKLNEKGERVPDPQPGHVFMLNEPSESFVQHFAKCKDDVLKAKNWTHLQDERMQARPERNGPIGYMATFTSAEKRVYSELMLFVVKGHFILIRKSCAAADMAASLDSPALQYLDWPQGAGGRQKDVKVQGSQQK